MHAIKNEITSQKNIGDNVITTLNVEVQRAAYEALGVYDGAIQPLGSPVQQNAAGFVCH